MSNTVIVGKARGRRGGGGARRGGEVVPAMSIT